MVKTPRTRHSKTSKEPVTIDLAPGEVSRAKAEAEKADPAKQTETPQQAKAEAPKPEDIKPAGAESSRPAASAAGTAGAKPQPESTATSNQQKPAAAAAGSSQTFGRMNKETVPPTVAAPSGRGGALAAGIAGGVIALVLAGGLQFAGLLPAPGNRGEQPADPTPAIDALEQEIATLRSEIGSAGAPDPELGGRVSQAEERVTTLASQIETLTGEVAGIAQEPGGEAAAPVDLSPLEERLTALEGTLGDAAPSQAVDDRLAALGEEIAAVREAQAAAGARLDTLQQPIGDLSGRVDEAAETPATAVIIAASALKAAIERGVPFTAELDTLAALAPDAPQIADLRALAADGVPTRAQIAEESDAAANAMIAAARPVDPQAGVIDRLMGSAMSLVQVRPVGMVEGDGVPEIVARLDAAVQAGDYERAIAEYDALPEPAKTAGATFIEKVRARQSADRLIDEALAAALAN